MVYLEVEYNGKAVTFPVDESVDDPVGDFLAYCNVYWHED